MYRLVAAALSRKHHVPDGQPRSLKFHEMTRRQKIIFVLKVAACVISFGMIYPNIMHD
jgi:hypothetical protein